MLNFFKKTKLEYGGHINNYEDIIRKETNLPVYKDRTPSCKKSTMTKEKLEANRIEVFGNRETCIGKSRPVSNKPYENKKQTDTRHLMPSEMIDPCKQINPYRVNDPYVQSYAPEEYYIKDL